MKDEIQREKHKVCVNVVMYSKMKHGILLQ
jgi:hypothetical protein